MVQLPSGFASATELLRTSTIRLTEASQLQLPRAFLGPNRMNNLLKAHI